MKTSEEIIGLRYGKLVITEDLGNIQRINKNGKSVVNRQVKCLCDCGNFVEIPFSYLKGAMGTKSCGCSKGTSLFANKQIEYNGETKSLREWCNLYGISYQTYVSRKNRGMNDIESFTTPINKARSHKTKNPSENTTIRNLNLRIGILEKKMKEIQMELDTVVDCEESLNYIREILARE